MHGIHRLRSLGIIAGLAILEACAVPHNDVLVFGTETKIALDVSSSATDAGMPSITLGYKREEAVWMPLLANGRDAVLLNGVDKHCVGLELTNFTGLRGCADKLAGSKDVTSQVCPQDDENCVDIIAGKLITLIDQKLKYIGTTGAGDRDAYSVFASFGAEIEGSGESKVVLQQDGKTESLGNVGSKAGLAQFFATGIAARKLAENKNIQKALKVTSNDSDQNSSDPLQDELDKWGISRTDFDNRMKIIEAKEAADDEKLAQIEAHLMEGSSDGKSYDATKWTNLKARSKDPSCDVDAQLQDTLDQLAPTKGIVPSLLSSNYRTEIDSILNVIKADKSGKADCT